MRSIFILFNHWAKKSDDVCVCVGGGGGIYSFYINVLGTVRERRKRCEVICGAPTTPAVKG